MRKFPYTKAAAANGFTLIELMITIVVATILITIAVPSYMNQTRQAHRTEAKTALLDLAGREERIMSTNGVYSAAASDLGYSSMPWTTPTGLYTITITNVAQAVAPTQVAAGSPATFTLTATAIGPQLKDTPCLTFTLDYTGAQTATSANCW
jgi:type IV pilus assembly protein PilE